MAYLIFFYMYGFLLQHDDSSDDPDAVIHSDDDVEAEDEEFADVGMCKCYLLPLHKIKMSFYSLKGTQIYSRKLPSLLGYIL